MASDRKKTALVTSPSRRLLRLGGLLGRVGASVASDRAVGLVRSGPAAEAKRLENLVRNATRIAETLGEMKGAAMKVGQMLSLQDSWLPPEAAEVLRSLQREAPRVPPEVMRYEVEGSLQAPIGELFAEFEAEAFAAASIGQVHRARLFDGREVAVKIQYPAIREIVTADLKNLKRLLKSLFGLIFKADFEPLWEELRDRLLEELDYVHEAQNIERLRACHADVPEVVIPEVIAERSTDRVLTMELVEGIRPRDAVTDRYSRELRDLWGQRLFEFQLRGLFEHRLLHADPNFANFAFREDGSLVVYDFGSVKRVPDELARGYAQFAHAIFDQEPDRIPEILVGLGATRLDGSPIAVEFMDTYIELLNEMLRVEPEYRFGEDEEIYERLMWVGYEHFGDATDFQFPQHVILVARSMAGHFANMIRLGAAGPWREMVARYAVV